ncbi:sugar-binding transcriptional regulator [Neobacillus sp. FSL H8-0543]|uniref:sugar-binding transcriptional regulator n=1 Tax=Neobacillus sp. FSL H8-0543 TaxID=2954672 RepID=UPI0031594C8B
MDNERLRLLVKISQLYYQDGMNQQQIASKYNISRSQVSRFLSASKAEGIVEITIRNPFSDETLLENQLMELYNLREVIVVDTTDADDMLADMLIGKAAAAFFENVLKDNDVVGVMAGKSITALAKEVKDPQKSNVHFVPLVGGWGSDGMEWHSNTNAFLLGKNTKNTYSVLHAPAVVRTENAKETLVHEPEIAKLIEFYSKVDVALVGIGQISKDATHVKSTNMSEGDISVLENDGAVASIATSFIGPTGEQISTSFSDRMIGINGTDLKNVPLVLGVARGDVKTRGIHAALTGGWINVLVTDMKTAKMIIDIQKNS